MTELEALRQIAVLLPDRTPGELRAWLGSRQVAVARAQTAPKRFARTGGRGQYLIGPINAPTAWQSKARGVAVLALLVLNPGRWIELAPGRTLGAYSTAIGRAVAALAIRDVSLADALAAATSDIAPGTRLRTTSGRVEARWTPPAWAAIDGSTPFP